MLNKFRKAENPEKTISIQQIYSRLGTTPEQIFDFCEHWQLVKLALFGSVLRDDFQVEGNNKSDIDVLFTFMNGVSQSLMKRVQMKYELENLFGRDVDLVDRDEILQSHNLIRRKNILMSEEVIYEK